MGLMSVSSVVGLIAVSILTQIVYRLFFHPLRGFPGPRLAAVSYLPEIYHDVIRGGMYMWEIEKMHQEYGTWDFNCRLNEDWADSHPQGRSYGSIHVKSTSKTLPSMRRYMLVGSEFARKIPLSLSRF